MAILMHKLTLASLTAGLQEGKLLMRDWLVILVSHFNLQDGRGDFEVAAASGGPVDTDFKQAGALQDIPRYGPPPSSSREKRHQEGSAECVER